MNKYAKSWKDYQHKTIVFNINALEALVILFIACFIGSLLTNL